mgnify:CR=1 FL=1
MILRHRDKELLRFEWVGDVRVRIVSVNEAERKFLPIDMAGKVTDESLWTWIERRVAPISRTNIQNLLLKQGLDPKDTRHVLELCRALSLNDVYWIAGEKSKKTWAEVNLYENAFSKTVSFLALTGEGSISDRGWRSSPEYTTDGNLAKCWRRVGDEVRLYKTGTKGAINAGFEPYSEFYAAQIAEALELPHAKYGLEKFKGKLCCTSPLFTSDRYSFVSAKRMSDILDPIDDPRFSNVFFFDALIFNTDRHMGNFGYLVDNDTNEIVDAAPIFDNGYGLFSQAVEAPGSKNHEFDDLRLFLNRVRPACYDGWLSFPGGVTAEMKDRLRKLIGFRFTPHHTHNLHQRRLREIESFLQKRVLGIIEYGEKADDLLKVSANSGTINQDHGHDSLKRAIVENLRADSYITQEELCEILSVTRSVLTKAIAQLQSEGRVTRVGSRKTGYWQVNEGGVE